MFEKGLYKVSNDPISYLKNLKSSELKELAKKLNLQIKGKKDDFIKLRETTSVDELNYRYYKKINDIKRLKNYDKNKKMNVLKSLKIYLKHFILN